MPAGQDDGGSFIVISPVLPFYLISRVMLLD